MRWAEDFMVGEFRTRCGWAAMSITTGVVEHFVSQAESRADQPELAYDWNNYRYAMPEINSRKGKSRLLDPFDVCPGWFRISLPSLRLRMTDAIPREYRERAKQTLEQLDLDRGFKLMRLRERYMRVIAAASRELHDTPPEQLDEAMLAYRTELFAARTRAGASVP
jgi:hypothetical protein